MEMKFNCVIKGTSDAFFVSFLVFRFLRLFFIYYFCSQNIIFLNRQLNSTESIAWLKRRSPIVLFIFHVACYFPHGPLHRLQFQSIFELASKMCVQPTKCPNVLRFTNWIPVRFRMVQFSCLFHSNNHKNLNHYFKTNNCYRFVLYVLDINSCTDSNQNVGQSDELFFFTQKNCWPPSL